MIQKQDFELNLQLVKSYFDIVFVLNFRTKWIILVEVKYHWKWYQIRDLSKHFNSNVRFVEEDWVLQGKERLESNRNFSLGYGVEGLSTYTNS